MSSITFDQPSQGTVESDQDALVVRNGADNVTGNGTAVHGWAKCNAGVYGESAGASGHLVPLGHPVPLNLQGIGVAGRGTNTGVLGSSQSGEGVFGSGKNGVHGQSASATDSGVWGENTGAGYGVAGSSQTGEGVLGSGRNGVHGRSASANDSGVWGENTGAGYGVSGSSAQGCGVIGLAAGALPPPRTLNGVFGCTTSANDSGVWGNNAGSGYGISGSSTNGTGVYGKGGHLAGRFEGDVEITGDIRLINQDCAEDFDIAGAESITPGTVMVIATDGTLQVGKHAYDNRVAGVVSGAGNLRPGIVLGRQDSRDKRLPIALLGKVYCKVDASFYAIDVGDLLTSSPTLGHAMKAVDRVKAFGAVLGKALAPLPQGQGMIPILVALQ
jgi:hypothetical protein